MNALREKGSRFIKVTSKTKVNCCCTLDRFEQTLNLVLVLLWLFSNVHCGTGSISMSMASHIHNVANFVIAKNNCQGYFKNLRFSFLENNRVQ